MSKFFLGPLHVFVYLLCEKNLKWMKTFFQYLSTLAEEKQEENCNLRSYFFVNVNKTEKISNLIVQIVNFYFIATSAVSKIQTAVLLCR